MNLNENRKEATGPHGAGVKRQKKGVEDSGLCKPVKEARVY